jgi:hypothetical protein
MNKQAIQKYLQYHHWANRHVWDCMSNVTQRGYDE